jgi:hypothetical protein
MKVKIKDRKEEISYLHNALKIAGYPVTYQNTDEINEIFMLLKRKKGKSTIKEVVEIQHSKEKEWDEYFKNLNQTP